MKYDPTKPILLALAMGWLLAMPAHSQPGTKPFFFRDGDRVVILGDSITEQQTYSILMESFVLSRFPTWKITFRNTGWEGDKMGLGLRGGQDAGIARDIAPLQPTAITVDFGMNDVQGGEKGVDIYLQNARTLTDKLKALNARVALLTSSSKESNLPDVPAGASDNIALRLYADGLKGVAAEKDARYVDQFTPFVATIEAGRKAKVLSDEKSGPRLTKDGTHPTWDGGLVMAVPILKGLNAPSLVSRVELDAKTGTLGAENAKVSEIKIGPSLSFVRLDQSLPWPIGKAPLALAIPGFTPLEDLSRYDLKITNLTAAKYDLLLDNQKVTTFTAAQLAAGVNLSALTSGPIADQQNALLKAILEKNATYKMRWRKVQLFELPPWGQIQMESLRKAELLRLDALIANQEAEINTLRLPKPHSWMLQPAT